MIESRFFRILIDNKANLLRFETSNDRFPELISKCFWVIGKTSSGHRFDMPLKFEQFERKNSGGESEDQAFHIKGESNDIGLEWRMDFSLPQEFPLAFWRVSIKNISSESLRISQIGLLSPPSGNEINLYQDEGTSINSLSFFSNGWQSWSYSGVYQTDDLMRRSRLGFLQQPMVMNPGTPIFYKKGQFPSDFFGVIGCRSVRKGLLIGFLSQKQHFGTITADLRTEPSIKMWANGDDARLDPGGSITTDWAMLQTVDFSQTDPIGPYINAVAQSTV